MGLIIRKVFTPRHPETNLQPQVIIHGDTDRELRHFFAIAAIALKKTAGIQAGANGKDSAFPEGVLGGQGAGQAV